MRAHCMYTYRFGLSVRSATHILFGKQGQIWGHNFAEFCTEASEVVSTKLNRKKVKSEHAKSFTVKQFQVPENSKQCVVCVSYRLHFLQKHHYIQV